MDAQFDWSSVIKDDTCTIQRLGNGTELYDGDMEDFEGMNDMSRPCQDPCEVPLDFVKPLFDERFSYWKHELVLGEYERRNV